MSDGQGAEEDPLKRLERAKAVIQAALEAHALDEFVKGDA